MINDPESKEVVGSKKVKQVRPDGLDVARYRNLKNWSYRRWAWEFLRRNVDFILACKSATSGTEEEKMAVAQKFGLKKFKKYTESYKGESGYPIFSTGSITSLSNLDCDKNSIHRKKIEIKAGQVVIRFDLASAMNDKKSLKKQLRNAEQKLTKLLIAYEEIIHRKADAPKHKVSSFGKYIRLLDHWAAGKSRSECAQLIYPDEAKSFQSGDRKPFDMNNLIKNQLKMANEYAKERYRYLPLMKGKPSVIDIPLIAVKSKAVDRGILTASD